jgi:apolipoprotein N-acyltransferase
MTAAGGPAARAAGFLSCLSGWRRVTAAILLGALAAAAQPPVHALPLLFVSFTGLVWMLAGATRARAAFAVGWFFGAGYFGAGLYWVSNALLVDAARFAWLIPFAIGGLAFGLGLFSGAAALAAWRVGRGGWGRALALAGAWALVEWLRGVVLTGFPWNPVGNVWVAVPPVLQGAAWIGVYGLSLLTVFAAAAPAALAGAGPRRALAGLSGCVLLVLVAAPGAARLAGASDAAVDGVRLRIVQPAIDQRDKWRPESRAQNFALHLRLSTAPASPPPTHVIWPETATTFSAATDETGRALMRGAVPSGGLIVTGAPRLDVVGGRIRTLWNGIVAVDGNGAVAGLYDKHHLVPFGEYTPFRDILPLDKIAVGAIDFSPGPGPSTLRLPGLPPVSPLVCYEAIFPGEVTAPGDRPGWMLNVTNDGWFGISAGPHQHLASARLRAVEEGLPLVRAANTGISAVFDGYGRTVANLGLGRSGFIDSLLPRALPPTPFARYGNAIPLLISALFLCVAAVSGRNHRLMKI